MDQAAIRRRVRQGWGRFRARWARMPVWLARLLMAVPLAWLAYVLVANIVLNTPLGPGIITIWPERFQAQWRAAATVWPGRLHVWDGRIQGQVERMRWEVHAGRLDCRIALLPLLRRELRFTTARADEVHAAARGLPAGAAPLEPLPRRDDGWNLRFDDITTDSLRQVAVGPFVLEGRGHGRLAFSTRLHGGPLQIHPSRLRFEDGSVRQGDIEWIRGLAFEGELALPAHTRDQARGLEKLALARVTGTAQAKGLALQGRILPDGGARLGVVRGAGELDARLALDRGVLGPDTHVDLRVPIQLAGPSGTFLDETMQLAVDVDDGLRVRARIAERQDGHLNLDADLRLQGDTLPPLRLPALLERTSGHASGRWHFPSMGWLPALIGSPPWLQMGGAAAGEFDVVLDRGRPGEGSRFTVQGAQVVANVMGVRAQGAADVSGTLGASDSGRVRTRLSIELRDYDLVRPADGLRFASGRSLHLDASADGLPAALGGQVESLDARLLLEGAQVPDMRVYNALLTRALRVDAGKGTIDADLRLDPRGGVADGTLRLRAAGARMHLLGMPLQGGLDVDAKVRSADLGMGRFVLDGTRVRLDGIHAGGKPGWWVDARLRQATLAQEQPGGPTALDARADVEMRDASLLLELFAQRQQYPRWIDRIIDAGRGRGSTHIRWDAGGLRLDPVEARNDRFDVSARIRARDDQMHGNLLARWGVLAAGVELRNGQRHFHLVNARRWYESQPAP